MEPSAASSAAAQPASLVVVDPGGHRTRVPIDRLPFEIGRQPTSNLILRDSRVSRAHSRIVAEAGEYVVEDCGSRHGTFVNGRQVMRQTLRTSDRIDFGAQDSYQLIFVVDGAELQHLMEQFEGGGGRSTLAASPTADTSVLGGRGAEPGSAASHPSGLGANLGKLRAILELARMLQSSFSLDDVLIQVVDTALAVTGAERGFLLLRSGEGLETRVARHRKGHKLHEDDLRVPRAVIHKALHNRRELLSMNFDPAASGGATAEHSVADLELRSAICVPLVRIQASRGDATNILSTGNETVGVLYMDSRVAAADLAGGNRELLQTLAMEASTVLENARLLEEERGKQKMEEELNVARNIQQSLLPARMPSEGWLRAAGSSVASAQVGGDYYDLMRVNPQCWAAVVADVSGKGVSSALLACLLQGALITATDHPNVLERRIERLNGFLFERTGGERYATVFYCLLEENGYLHYINAAHCPPLVVRPGKGIEELEATGMPVGLLDTATFALADRQLSPGDKVVIYTDGVTEAQNAQGAFFGKRRLKELLQARGGQSCAELHDAIQDAVASFIEGAAQSDDITLLVIEFQGA